VILVTSERKEDWWEIINGKRLGARRELIEEAARVAGQRVLLYEREHFLKEAAETFQLSIGSSVLREMRAFEQGNPKTKDMQAAAIDEIVVEAVDRLSVQLVDSEAVSSCIAETNASGFYADEVEAIDTGPLDISDMTIPFQARVHFTGEQGGDQMYCGDSIYATVTGRLEYDGESWSVADDYDVTAEVDQDEYDVDDDQAD
jgi:hypothetical protein